MISFQTDGQDWEQHCSEAQRRLSRKWKWAYGRHFKKICLVQNKQSAPHGAVYEKIVNYTIHISAICSGVPTDDYKCKTTSINLKTVLGSVGETVAQVTSHSFKLVAFLFEEEASWHPVSESQRSQMQLTEAKICLLAHVSCFLNFGPLHVSSGQPDGIIMICGHCHTRLSG